MAKLPMVHILQCMIVGRCVLEFRCDGWIRFLTMHIAFTGRAMCRHAPVGVHEYQQVCRAQLSYHWLRTVHHIGYGCLAMFVGADHFRESSVAFMHDLVKHMISDAVQSGQAYASMRRHGINILLYALWCSVPLVSG